MNPTHSHLRTVALLASIGLVGCGDCSGSAVQAPALESTGGSAESGAAAPVQADTGASGTDAGTASNEPIVPPRPASTHTTAPTAADFAVEPVTGDWSTYRGNGARSGTRAVPSIRTPRVAWAVEVGIQGYANTTLVTSDTLYVGSQGQDHNTRPTETDAGDGVLALNAADGSMKWRFPTTGDTNGLTLEGETLLVSTDAGILYALDRTSGAERWRLDTGCDLFHGAWVAGGQVWIQRRTGTVRVDLNTGSADAPLGNCAEERGSFAGSGTATFSAPSSRELEAWEGTQMRWAARDDGAEPDRLHTWTPPLLTSSMAIVAYSRWPFEVVNGRAVRRNAVVAHWRDDSHPAWVLDVNDPELAVDDSREPTQFLRAMPWISGERLYYTPTTRPELVAYDVTTGQVAETLALPDCRRRQFASIVGTTDMGYLARHDGVLYGFTTQPLAIAWTLHLGLHGLAGTADTHMPIAAGCTPEPTDGTALFATPSIGPDGTLYVGSGDGWLYAIRDAATPAQ